MNNYTRQILTAAAMVLIIAAVLVVFVDSSDREYQITKARLDSHLTVEQRAEIIGRMK